MTETEVFYDQAKAQWSEIDADRRNNSEFPEALATGNYPDIGGRGCLEDDPLRLRAKFGQDSKLGIN